MQSILSKSGMSNLHLIFEADGKIDEEIALIVKEVEAHYTAQGCEFVEFETYLEPIRRKLGDKFAATLGGEISSQMLNHEIAAFALGYYTAKCPEWLVFQAHTPD